jgi:hypothetical protein
VRWLAQWWKNFRFSPYDWRGNVKFLRERLIDPGQATVAGVPDTARDDVLRAICRSFEIPERQMHCLRGTDELMELYRQMNGPRNFDHLQFEELWFELDKCLERKVTWEEMQSLLTVAQCIQFVAGRSG